MSEKPYQRGQRNSALVRGDRADDHALKLFEAAERAIASGARSLSAITKRLNDAGFRSPNDCPLTPAAVKRAIERQGKDWRDMVKPYVDAEREQAEKSARLFRLPPEHYFKKPVDDEKISRGRSLGRVQAWGRR